MNKRKEQTDAKYRQKFSELGINGFEYIRFENKNNVFFRCKKCGVEFSRSNDLFKGKQTKLICHECGNGKVIFSDLANEALKYYAEGHTDAETIAKFGISENDLKNWAKARRVSNGRKFGHSSNDIRIRKSEPEARRNAELMGFVIFGVWVGRNHTYTAIDVRTGEFVEMNGQSFFPNRNAERRKKKRDFDIVDSDINIVKLIKRDGRRCYICGKETDFRDKRWGRFGPDFPTIDHVKPIKLGGVHSWDNVRVCCGRCNVRKGARYEKATK